MPGYSQLKKLSEQILKLGNEINVRASRNEKAFPYPVPSSIPDTDDSDDFINGMPEKPKTPEEIAAEEAAARAEEEAKAAAERAASGEDDLFGSSSSSFGADLSAFDEGAKSIKEKSKKKSSFPTAKSFLEEEEEAQEEEEEAPPPKKGINGTGYSGFGFDDDGNLEPNADDDPGPDIASLMGGPGKPAVSSDTTGFPELDDLLNQNSDSFSPPAEEPAPAPEPVSEPTPAPEPEAPSAPETSSDPFDLGDLGDFGSFGDLDAFETPAASSEPVAEEPVVPNVEEPVAEQSALFIEEPAAPEPEPSAPEASAPEPETPAPTPVDDGIDLSDLGIDGLEIEDYTPTTSASKPASSADFELDLDSLLGSGEPFAEKAPKIEDEKIEVTEFKENPKAKVDLKAVAELKKKEVAKKSFEPQDIESDIAILKPDIFTANPVTSANPPYYVTGPFGKLPKTPEQEAEEAAAAKAAAEAAAGKPPKNDDEGPSGFGDIDFDAMEREEKDAESAPSSGGVEIPTGIDDSFTPTDDGVTSFADTIDMNADLPGGESVNAAPASDGDDIFNTDIMDSGFGSDASIGGGSAPAASDDIFSADIDFSSFGDAGGGEGTSADIDTSGGMPDFGDLGGTTDFSGGDGSSFDGFSIPDTDSQLNAAKNDFELAGDDFSIPGFSEVDADPYAKKKGLDSVDFSGAMPGVEKQRTSLTEEEYKKFRKNLMEYPLNVRITVEDMIVKNEFTDEVVFELIDKIINKVTARQLAGYLEKMLDITLHVPRDFEKRTVAEYEAYKASFGYQLKSRIIPAVLIGMLIAMMAFCVGYLGLRYVVNPLWAEKLYKEGYTLLEHDDYPQSEIMFARAVEKKPKKKWYYKYAQGYRAHRQYDRAEKFYKAILHYFDHDKQAGLEYAQMQVEDLGEYERAEEILKREVLDYHVNDPDGILALGDTYLEWATEVDTSKFHDAFDQYSLGAQLYGSKNQDLYQSRFLRYYIRTDQLHKVLELKEFFYPREKSLGASDWTELSGYLMDKLYGELPRNEEYLRDKIEDLRDMMIFAIKADPENPISNYNLSRYLVEVGDHTKAMQSLKTTKDLFDKAQILKKRDVYKQLNNYRLLGEEYLYDREYLKARETFIDGINLFEKRQRFGKFEGDKNIGSMYADMGNLEYFISGDLSEAKRNYNNAIKNKMDTPSIRYRVGYVCYTDQDYTSALGNFLKASEQGALDSHTMLALGNTLSLKNDNYTAQSYYDRLLSYLDFQREKYGIVIPQIDPAAGDMVEVYMKAANNLGVSQFRVSRQSGDSSLNAKALVNFQNSIRYYDALTRNQETMVRLPGSNLAEQNLRYATHPISEFEPAIYTEIPRVLDGEKGLEQ